jgi:hypothetical protein
MIPNYLLVCAPVEHLRKLADVVLRIPENDEPRRLTNTITTEADVAYKLDKASCAYIGAS